MGEAAARVSRIPPGHPEGYLEAFATIYSEAAAAILAGATPVAAIPTSPAEAASQPSTIPVRAAPGRSFRRLAAAAPAPASERTVRFRCPAAVEAEGGDSSVTARL